MLTRILKCFQYPFSIRLKGPTSQRKADNQVKIKQIRTQNFFADYSPQTNQFYKNGFTPNELQNSNEMVKRAFSLQNATPGQILNYRIQQAIKKYQRHLLDHGSPAIQCAIMSEKIILLMNHISKYPKDKKAGRFLTQIIQKRRNMLDYCMRRDYHRYKWVCIDYGIPDQHSKTSNHKTFFKKFKNPTCGY